MRWNDLFNDLEGQLDAAHAAEFEAGVRDLALAERATVVLAARLAASRGAEIALRLRDGSRVGGRVADASGAWVLVAEGPREHVVPVSAIAQATGVAHRAEDLGAVASKLGLGHALRAVAGERYAVIVATSAGEVRGRITHVGGDHLDVEPGGGEAAVAIPFAEVLRVTSSGPVR